MAETRITLSVQKLLGCLPLLLSVFTLLVTPKAEAQTTVFINEIHYDNTGGDTGEAVEVAGPAGTDLTGWSIVLYNGNGGTVYDTDPLSGSIPDLGGGFGVVVMTYPSNGIQNGSPDAIALVDNTSSVVQFLSYEGAFMAVGGPADGLMSTDIGASESGGGAIGNSLQLSGTGTAYEDFVWNGEAPNTFGLFNTGQSFGAGTPRVVINEIDYDQPSTDTAEFVELYNAGSAVADLSTYTLELVSSASASIYESFTLPSVSLAPGDFFVICGDAAIIDNCDLDVSPNTNLIQNGAPDAVGLRDGGVLVDAVSYEGDVPGYTEGSGTGLVDDGSPDLALSRLPDGADTDQNNADFSVRCNTPGEGNTSQTTNCGGAPVTPEIVINEIDYDQPSTDTAEFIELYNAGASPADLDLVDVLLVNGNGGAFYQTIDLPAVTLAPGDYYVLCADASTVINCDLDVLSSIQNGAPDAVALRYDGSTQIDAVSYEGDVPDYTEGSGAGLEDAPGVDFAGISRYPDGADTDQNNLDLSLRCISPGAANLVTSSGCSDPSALLQMVINEVDADTPGGDDMEFVELFGAPNTPLDGLVVVFYNGSDDASYNAFDLDGYATDANGFFVLCGDAGNVPSCDLDASPNTDLIQNGADAVALHLGDAADFPNDTPVTIANLIDALVYDTNDSDDAALLVLLNVGQPQVNEDGNNDKDNHSNQRVPNGSGGQRNTDAYTQIPPTPGAVNSAPPAVVEIFEIQGAGVASPYAGHIVIALNNAVTAVASNGFFMQTPTDRADPDSDTSDGIFVFTGGAPGVSVGDRVDVTGEIIEFNGFTEFSNGPTVAVVGTGSVPAPVVFDAATPSQDPNAPSCDVAGNDDIEIENFECFEGMLIEMSGTVGESNQFFNPDPIAEVYVRAGTRVFREEGIELPAPSGLPGTIPIWDGNPEVFELDPDGLNLPNQIIPARSTFTATGVLGYQFGDYALRPSALVVNEAPLPVPVREAEVDEGTVASLNLFRLFDDVDDPPSTNAQGEPRDDEVVLTTDYQTRLEKFSRYIRDVLRVPDVLAVQEVEKLGVLEALADRIATDDPAVHYEAYLIEGNDIGTIDVGYLVRVDRFQVDAVTQLGKEETYTVPGSGDQDLIFDRPPLLLEGQFAGGREVAVLNLHLRSLSGINGGDGERVRAKRLAGAQSVAQKVDDFQDTNLDVGLAVVGDLNAFQFTDGYVHVTGRIQGDFDDDHDLESGPDLVDPNLTNQVLSLPAEERYSFVFNGNAQVLDHALTTSALDPAVTGFAYGRGNADAASVKLDDPTTPLRSSDHDGLVLYVDALPVAHAFVLLAGDKLKSDGPLGIEGDVHSNDEIDLQKGAPSIYDGNLTAAGGIKIDKDNTITGDARAGGKLELKGNAAVLGTTEEHAMVDPVPLPELDYAAGGAKVKVEKGEAVALTPGSYDEVRVEAGATLQLAHDGTSGDYFFKKLELKKDAVLEVDVANGRIEVNVVDKVDFDKDTSIEILPLGEVGSRWLTINSLKDIKADKNARLLGDLIAPYGKVELKKEASLRGAICAEEIDLDKDVHVLHHNAAVPLPAARSATVLVASGTTTEPIGMPEEFALAPNYPNPFNPTTTIEFALPEATSVTLRVFDVTGRVVARLADGAFEAGRHQVRFDASGLPSGVYFYQIRAGRFIRTNRMVLMK